MAEEILYTPEELAGILKLSKYTIYEMIKRGDIPAHRIGRSIRISQTQLDFYLTAAKAAENVYEADLVTEDGMQYAVAGSVKICVSTELRGHVKISVPPEDIILCASRIVCSARNQHKGTVVDVIHDQRTAKVLLDIGIPMIVLITTKSMSELGIQKGSEIFAIFKTMSVRVHE